MGPRTRRILVDFTKIFVISVPFYKCAQCFSFFLPKFSQALQNFKGAVVCLRAGQTFVKRQNCQFFQVAGVNLAENACQVNLISLFKSLLRQKSVKIFDPCVHYCICCFQVCTRFKICVETKFVENFIRAKQILLTQCVRCLFCSVFLASLFCFKIYVTRI